MCKKPIFLVGNGPILDPNLGSYIDSFTRVMRFNTFRLDGHQKAVGSKVTDWVMTGGRFGRKLKDLSAWDLLIHCMSGLERVLVRINPETGIRVIREFYRVCGIPYDHLIFLVGKPRDTISPARRWWPTEIFNSVKDRLGKSPTTGLLGIMLAIEYYCDPPVHIACFGPRDKYVKGHYYRSSSRSVVYKPDEPILGKVWHNWHGERDIINEWEDQGLVRRCDI